MELTDAEVEQLYHRYAHVLFHRCRTLVRNDEEAWDVVHDTFAKVIRQSDTFRRQASPLTWMYKISTNACLNRIRDGRTHERKHEQHSGELGVGASASIRDEDPDRHRVLALLDDADEETRACVVHTFFDDCTREEVAELVGLSVPTVRKRVNTFLERARKALGVVATALVATLIAWSAR